SNPSPILESEFELELNFPGIEGVRGIGSKIATLPLSNFEPLCRISRRSSCAETAIHVWAKPDVVKQIGNLRGKAYLQGLPGLERTVETCIPTSLTRRSDVDKA